jgi:uncharacterized PurR-regulated membrane protein YhhQ (DUF165 family)
MDENPYEAPQEKHVPVRFIFLGQAIYFAAFCSVGPALAMISGEPIDLPLTGYYAAIGVCAVATSFMVWPLMNRGWEKPAGLIVVVVAMAGMYVTSKVANALLSR